MMGQDTTSGPLTTLKSFRKFGLLMEDSYYWMLSGLCLVCGLGDSHITFIYI